MNLKFSRKLTVFSSVLAILVDHIDTYEKIAPIAAMTPMERLSYALDRLDDPSLAPGFAGFLDDYEEFLAAKSHAELEELDEEMSAHFRQTAQKLDDFLHAAFASSNLDRQLVKYLLI